MASKTVRGKGIDETDTNALLQKLVDLLVERTSRSTSQESTISSSQQKLFDLLMERLSKISGALRYKDAGFSIQINGSFNSSGRYTVQLPNEIQLFPQASYEISMQTFAVEQSIPNITETSNTFYFSKTDFNSGAIQTIILPNGTYDLDSINATIQVGMRNLGVYNTSAAANAANTNYYVTIGWVAATLKTSLSIQYGSKITVYFNRPNSFYKILGFQSTDVFTDPNPTQVTSTATINWYQSFYSTNILNLTINIISLNFGCTLARGSVLIQSNGVILPTSQIMATKPYIDLPGSILSLPSYNYPYIPLWLKMDDSCKRLRIFDVFCLDNNNQPVTFSFNNFNMVIAIRQV